MGKSLQPLKAIDVRQPANTPPAAGSPVASPAPNEPATAESLGWQLRAALPPLRLHSVSLYDEQANVLWLSEGALGPDEHNVVVEAIDALGSDTTVNCYETGLEDGRIALFLPVRSPQGGLVGLAMILADIKSVGDGVIERLVTPQIRTIMQKLAVLLRPAQPRSAQGDSALPIFELAPDAAEAPVQAAPKGAAPKAAAPVSTLALTPPGGRNASAAAAAPVKHASPPALSPEAVDDILEFELTPDLPSPPVRNSQTQRLPALAAVNGVDLSLDFDKPAAKPVPVAPVAATVPVRSAPLAAIDDSLDLNLPSLEPPAPTVFASNVAPFPSPVSAVTPAAAPAAIATIPTIGAAPTVGAAVPNTPSLSAVIPTLGAAAQPAPMAFAAPAPMTSAPMAGAPAAATVAPAPAAATPPTLGSTTTSKALGASATSTGKVLPAATGTSKALGATTTSRVLTLPEGMSLILEVQPFSKLRAGGRTRRYEVLARSSHPNRIPPGLDKIALQQLLAWMGSNRAAWNLEPTSFTLNLSISTLEDERFPQFVASNLKANGIAPDNIGFEIAEPLCLQRRAQVERFITLCDKLGCFVVIDDFSLDSSIVSLLRSKALRLVKIDPKLTSVALKDKLAQAMVVAIAQAVKVLGIHCAAKRVESQAALQWLTAIGCDFAQGAALAPVQPLESMALPPAPTPGQSA
jgi:EAL domain-containing protein (putative c-di-GMP-specific phosphodiesterase class I)